MKRLLKRVLYVLFSVFILMNLGAFMHAWRFTHFSENTENRTASPHQLGTLEKLGVLFTGVNNPRPVNTVTPSRPFETLMLPGEKKAECWYIPSENAKGTVVLFHGYCSKKSALLGKSEAFNGMGYNTLLVDFMGSGNSEGNQTSIGFYESAQVIAAYRYLEAKGENNIILFGSSLGAAAIMKALNDSALSPSAIIVECPFGSMQETVDARFRNMNVPSFPMAPLLVFWGGVQNGFWAFDHNPAEYAKKISSPVLLLHGEKDDRVTRGEIDRIYENLAGKKLLITYPLEGHSIRNGPFWIKDVSDFLKSQHRSKQRE